jgi:hypothetical protein
MIGKFEEYVEDWKRRNEPNKSYSDRDNWYENSKDICGKKKWDGLYTSDEWTDEEWEEYFKVGYDMINGVFDCEDCEIEVTDEEYDKYKYVPNLRGCDNWGEEEWNEYYKNQDEDTTTLATVTDEHGEVYYIYEDSHCYVLFYKEKNKSHTYTTHIFKEAFEVLRTLPELHDYERDCFRYKQVKPTPEIVIAGSNRKKRPVATLISKSGGIRQIIVNDGCYVVCYKDKDGKYNGTGSFYIDKETFEVLKTLPSLV